MDPSQDAVTPPLSQNNTAPEQMPYTSNPFAASVVGLGKALVVNPIASLLLSVLPIVFIIGTYILAAIFSAVTKNNYAVVILAVVAAVVSILIVARALLGAIFVLKSSRANQATSAKRAMNSEASPYIGRFVGIALLMILIAILVGGLGIGIGAALAGSSVTLAVLLGLISYLFVIFLLVRFSLAPFVLVNEDTKVIASLKRSYALSKGHFLELLSVLVVQQLIVGSGLLFAVGSVSGLDTRYHEISAYKNAALPKPKTHWTNWLVLVLIGLILAAYGLAFALTNSAEHKFRDYDSDRSSGQNSTDSGRYCYFDDQFEYTCASSESACRAVEACKTNLDAADSLNDFTQTD